MRLQSALVKNLQLALAKVERLPYIIPRTTWGRSSAGRALDWQSRGQGFDPPRLHHRMLTGSDLSGPVFIFIALGTSIQVRGKRPSLLNQCVSLNSAVVISLPCRLDIENPRYGAIGSNSKVAHLTRCVARSILNEPNPRSDGAGTKHALPLWQSSGMKQARSYRLNQKLFDLLQFEAGSRNTRLKPDAMTCAFGPHEGRSIRRVQSKLHQIEKFCPGLPGATGAFRRCP